MKKRLTSTTKALLATLLLLSGNYLHAQVTVGDGTAPQDFSVLELSTENLKGGLRLPHLSTQERNDLVLTPNFQAQKTTTAKGLVIYNTDTDCMESWNGTKWISLCESIDCATLTGITVSGGPTKESWSNINLPLRIDAVFSSGIPNAIYDWYSNTTASTSGGSLMQSGTSNIYLANNNKTRDYYYYCVVTACDGSSQTSPVITVTNNCGAKTTDGKWLKFMCHNLGANENADPFTYVEGNADGSGGTLGWLYQWGRPTDGHQLRKSDTTATLATNNTATAPAGIQDKFITASASPFDWRSGGGETSRWSDGTKATNDPCPTGWKVPSQVQWASIFRGGITSGAPNTATANIWAWTGNGFKVGESLYLPAAGSRYYGNGTVAGVGTSGAYSSSTANGISSYYLDHNNSKVIPSGGSSRGHALSVRCVAQ